MTQYRAIILLCLFDYDKMVGWPIRLDPVDEVVQRLESVLKWLAALRGDIKELVFNFLPARGILGFHDAHSLVEQAAPGKELAVQRRPISLR